MSESFENENEAADDPGDSAAGVSSNVSEKTLEQIVSAFVHARDKLADDHLAILVDACRSRPEFTAKLRDQLIVDEVLRQELDEGRGDFVAQMEQRLRDEQSGMQGGLSGLADLLPVGARNAFNETTDDESPGDVAGESEFGPDYDNGIDLHAHAVRELEQWQRAQQRGRTRSLVAGIVAVLLVAVGVTTWFVLTRPTYGELVAEGPVTVVREGEEIPVDARLTLELGDEVRIPAGSAAVVEYADDTRLELRPETALSVVASSSGGKRLDLEVGELRADVRPQPQGRPLVLGTPVARATVVGTKFVLTVRTGGATRLDVSEGEVELARLSGEAGVVVSGNEYAIAGTEASEPLRTMAARFPGTEWDERTPDEVGLDADAVQAFAKAVGGRGCLVRNGSLVHMWGDVSKPGGGSRASEAVWSHLLFLAIERGELDGLDDRVVVRRPRLADLDASGKDAETTWRQLVQHTSGYGTSAAPGEAFHPSARQLGLLADTLVREVFLSTWERFGDDVLRPELTGPIQCEDRPSFTDGGTGRLRISPRDLARFGLLHLHEGRWGDRRLLDRRFAAMATSTPVSNDVPADDGAPGPLLPEQESIEEWSASDHFGSYSFGWWLNGVDRTGQRLLPNAPTDTFVAIAADGHEALVVIPSLDLVATYTDGTPFEWKAGPENGLDRALSTLLSGVE